jgi:hypothetical protein
VPDVVSPMTGTAVMNVVANTCTTLSSTICSRADAPE